MPGPLIPKKLRAEYEDLAVRYRAATLPFDWDWALVAFLQDEYSDLYGRAFVAASRDPMVADAFSRAATWYQKAAQESRVHAERQVKR